MKKKTKDVSVQSIGIISICWSSGLLCRVDMQTVAEVLEGI